MCLVLMANPIINWYFYFFISIGSGTGTVLKYRFGTGIEKTPNDTQPYSQQQSSFVLSENRVEKLGGFKRVLREFYTWIYEQGWEGYF